jgi:alpha-beta hydrolase superfamily lysophospholipase
MKESPPRWIEPEGEDEARLALDLIPAAGRSSRLWFFVHGLNSHRRGDKALYFARQVARKGEAFASLDLTGHGDSEGGLLGLSLSRNLHDVDRGLRFVRQEVGPFSSVFLVGSSMGGLTALWYSALNPGNIAANLLVAPAFELAGRLLLSLGRSKAQKWREEGKTHLVTDDGEFDLGYGFVEDEARYPIATLVRKLETPTLILHGTEDEAVPFRLSKNFIQKVEISKLTLIAGGDHRLTDHKEVLFEEMWDFVSHLKGG